MNMRTGLTVRVLIFSITTSVISVGCAAPMIYMMIAGGAGGGFLASKKHHHKRGSVPPMPPTPCANTIVKAARLSVDMKKSLASMPDFFSDDAVVDFGDDTKDKIEKN